MKVSFESVTSVQLFSFILPSYQYNLQDAKLDQPVKSFDDTKEEVNTLSLIRKEEIDALSFQGRGMQADFDDTVKSFDNTKAGEQYSVHPKSGACAQCVQKQVRALSVSRNRCAHSVRF